MPAKKGEQDTTAVATRRDGAVTLPEEGAAGLSGEFGQSDITLPVCSLSQPMSQDRGKEGTFWFPDGRRVEGLEGAVRNTVGTRGRWADVTEGISGPLCRSADRREGYTERAEEVLGGNNEGSMYIPCEACPHFRDNETFESGSMRCRNGYTLLLYDTQVEAPFLYF